MFGIGSVEFLVIVVVAILVLGPDKLPKALRTINKVMSEFRKVTTDLQRAINMEAHQDELNKQQQADLKKKKKSAQNDTTSSPDQTAPADELAAEACNTSSTTTVQDTEPTSQSTQTSNMSSTGADDPTLSSSTEKRPATPAEATAAQSQPLHKETSV